MPTNPKTTGFDALDPSTWPPVLDVDQVAHILNLRRKQVQTLARARRLPGAYRLGRFWQFKAEALKRWLREDSAR